MHSIDESEIEGPGTVAQVTSPPTRCSPSGMRIWGTPQGQASKVEDGSGVSLALTPLRGLCSARVAAQGSLGCWAVPWVCGYGSFVTTK